jgi:prophage antirepressor-like protein
MSQLQVWNEFFCLNDEKSEVNIIQLEDNTFWFQFSHLAKLLGYSNPTVAIQTHCEDYEIQKLDIGKHELVNFVSESGFYSLVMGSNKPIAKKFKKWVCSDVLPKLRASGGYIMPTATSEQLEALQNLKNKFTLQLTLS